MELPFGNDYAQSWPRPSQQELPELVDTSWPIATPFSALALAVLAERAGVPAGISSAKLTGSFACTLVAYNDFQPHRAQTQRSPVQPKWADVLMQQCAPTIKKLSLELGGFNIALYCV